MVAARRSAIGCSLAALTIAAGVLVFGREARPVPPAAGVAGTYLVQRVVDGDTIVVVPYGAAAASPAAGSDTVRLIGVDTPETHDPRKPVQCFGPEAAAFTTHALTGARVRLTGDPVAGARDRYHRRLAYVWRDGHDLFNLTLLQGGYAREYDYDDQVYARRSEFRTAQAQARASGRGLWSPTTCHGAR